MTLKSLSLLLILGAGLAAQAPKNVIFFLGDGMGPAAITAARIYKVGERGELTMDTLPRTARIRTYSNDAQTTDSAPSMAAYMTGVKMNNEVISMSPDTVATAPVAGASTCAAGNGHPVPTLLELARAKGLAIGAVTTTRITHATPAATYAHICHRDAENDIAVQAVPNGAGYNAALGTGLDVMLGGGRRHFLPTSAGGKRTDGRDLTAELVGQGVTYVQTGTALSAVNTATTQRLLGLFHMDHMDFELDRVKKGLDQPSLAQMTQAAIEVLSHNPKGYVLMVEGGRIDHALHNTNAKRALEDTVAFDAAIAKALSMVDLKDTLIVVTADHDHTMVINGYAKLGNPILDIVRDYKTNAPVLDADGRTYTALAFGNGPNRPDLRTDVISGSADASQTLHDDYLQESAIRMPAGSETHGGGDVKLFATGAGSAAFKGTLINTQVFGLVKAALGL